MIRCSRQWLAAVDTGIRRSASVYFARKGIPYLNVEAQEGRLEEQIQMLRVVAVMLAEFNLFGPL